MVSLPLSELDILNSQVKNAIFSQAKSEGARKRLVFVKQSPLLDLTSNVTELVQVAATTYAISFSCGTIWIENVRNIVHENLLLGLTYMRKFLGQELKPSCINALAHLLVPWRESLSM